MIMDAKDIKSDMHALKKLYGLLTIDGDGDGVSASAVDLLDKPARVLLKSLLDETTKRILKEHSEIIVGQLDPPSPLEKPSVSTQGCQSHEKETASNKDREVGITLQKEKKLSQKWSQAVEAVLANGLEQREKRCCLCQRNTIYHIEPTVDCLSKEASETIERIDSCLSALCIRNFSSENKSASPASQAQCNGISSVGKSPRHDNFMGRSEFSSQTGHPFSYLLQPVFRFDSKALNESDASGRPGESFEECKFLGEKVSAIHDQYGRPKAEKIDLGNGVMNLYDFLIHDVENLGETSYKTPTWPATFPTIPLMNSLYQSCATMENECSTHKLFHMYKTPGSFMYPENCKKFQSVEAGLNVSSTFKSHAKNHPSNNMNETLSDNKEPPRPLDSLQKPSTGTYKDKTGKKKQFITARSVSLTNQESGSSATDSYSNSSSWKGRSIASDREEYTSTDQRREYATSSTCSQNATASQSYDTEDDAYLSSNGGQQDSEPLSSASSISKGYSSSNQPTPPRASLSYSSASKKSSSRRASRANNGKRLKKRTGMWKRMKEKMSIIFHHHHHHHHHHHDGRGFSLKQKHANFDRQDEEVYGEKAVGKMKKKSIVPKKDQPSHFHALMEGLWKHVRHSKQSKPRKENNVKLAKGRHDRHKASKKSHLWKLVQHRRKLPSKTNVKLVLGKKKARLKALPSIN